MLEFSPLVFAPPDSSLLYKGHYDSVLVVVSIVIAIFASYAFLLVSQHISANPPSRTKHLWTILGGVCLGAGIWTMHFVGMLAFVLPCSNNFSVTVTLLSTIPGILASTFAINIISRRALSVPKLLISGVLIGAGISAMHYSGMAAWRLNGLIRYDFKLFLLSILLAIALATLALWIKFHVRLGRARWNTWATLVSAAVIGLTVSAMHYTVMAAAYFVRNGDATIVHAGIAPTFLAAIVMAATSLIVVVTVVAIFVGKPHLLSLGRSYKLTGLMIVGWVAIAWLIANDYYANVANNFYQQEVQTVRQQAQNIGSNIDESLQTLKGIPVVVASSEETRQALRRFGANVTPSAVAYRERKQSWSDDERLGKLNKSLGITATNLKADVVWVLNAAGDCIASSNADQRVSFVGTNYADRNYFRQNQAGQRGHQYAMGRATGIPGLYYSAPVFEKGQFLGIAVVKRDISTLTFWTNPANAFLVDINGIIVLAPDHQLEFRAFPHASIAKLSTAQRLMQYKRSKFVPLEIARWGNERFPAAMRIGAGNAPVVLASHVLADDAMTVYLSRPLDELARLNAERLWLFFLLASTGSMLIVSASAIVFYLRELKRTETELHVAAIAFDSQQGMIITDAKNLILKVNRAFISTTGYAAHEVVGQTPHLLSSGRHDAAFFDDLWRSIDRTGSWQGEIWNRRKNGEVHPEWITITAVKRSGGEVTHYVANMSDISQRKAAEDEIKQLAFFDPLTSLPNRRLLTDRLRQALTASGRSGRRGALLFIDLDNFKTLNDTLGHHRGDLLLEQVARRLVECVREGDTVARFGGDEFVVMLEGLSENPEEAARHTKTVGEKILVALDQPYLLANDKHHSTSSIGATLFSGQLDSMDELLKQADLAMYQAKEAGRNALRFFDLRMQAVITARAVLETDLRQALHQKEFVLYYQPQVDDKRGVTGAEALLRWQQSWRGLVPPGEFISLAEETGLILPIGHWVLETACAQLVAWSAQPELAHLALSVNISARQFRHPDFVKQVLAVIEQTGVNPCRLKLEITESLLLDDLEDIVTKMTSLKTEGVSFSLDDFGTGYSSLSYLKRLPLDQLKIDQSFVRDILTDPNDAAIARTIVALAKSLGLSVIAEGVETEVQLDLLASEGCFAYQGYLFSRPLPLEEFEAFVKRV